MQTEMKVSLIESTFSKNEATIKTQVDSLAAYWEYIPATETMKLVDVMDADTGAMCDARVVDAIDTESGLFSRMKATAIDYFDYERKKWLEGIEHEDRLRNLEELSSEEITYLISA